MDITSNKTKQVNYCRLFCLFGIAETVVHFFTLTLLLIGGRYESDPDSFLIVFEGVLAETKYIFGLLLALKGTACALFAYGWAEVRHLLLYYFRAGCSYMLKNVIH